MLVRIATGKNPCLDTYHQQVNRMHNSEFLNRDAVSERNFNRADLSETFLSKAPVSEAPLREVTVPDQGLVLVPICFVLLVWSLVLLVRLDLWKTVRNRVDTVKSFEKIPCLNCQFFKNNPYLKCAVHPSTALSAEALNCPDYLPES